MPLSLRHLLLTTYVGLLVPLAVRAQFPPTPKGVTILQSKLHENITISYKEPGLCETTPGVRSYAGYVHLPPGTLADLGEEQDYPINTFFWFFEAREDPENAPLSIWMNGGPGSTSMLGLLAENGPCFINPDSNSTTLNPHSWNNQVNMLYLEQPVQVGLSYDTLANFTLDLISGHVSALDDEEPIPEQNTTFLVGTYPSQNSNTTAQGTRNAAIAMWHFAQVWFQEFPGYHPNDDRISIATESYGGRYGPAFAALFQEQNEKILNGTWPKDTHYTAGGEGEGKQPYRLLLHLDTVFLINACIDRQVQWPSYPHMAYNNTYGLQTVNETVYESMLDAYTREGGCRDQIDACQAVARAYDPDNVGRNATVNQLCTEAETFCSQHLRAPFQEVSGRNYYDVTQIDPDPFPYNFFVGWLNQPHVQSALGIPLNFSSYSPAVSDAFHSIGDYPRPGWLQDLAYLLERGIKVALAYGDRDYACNWIGGEAASLAIDFAHTSDFHAAGYEPITVATDADAAYVGGLVRQFGNLSYSRVFQAGHEIPSWQPETALAIFERALGNRDIATGRKDTSSSSKEYSSVGPKDTWDFKSAVPEQELWFCYTLVPGTCTEEQLAAVQNGSVRISRYVVEDANSTKLFPDLFGQEGEARLGQAMVDLTQHFEGEEGVGVADGKGKGGEQVGEAHGDTTEPDEVASLGQVGMPQLVLVDPSI